MKTINRFSGFFVIGNLVALFFIVICTTDERTAFSVSVDKLVSVKAGATKQGSTEYVQRNPMWCSNQGCYPAGGHGFMCMDNSDDDDVKMHPLIISNIDWTTTSFDCTPLVRYTFENCTPTPGTIIGDCDNDYDVAQDP